MSTKMAIRKMVVKKVGIIDLDGLYKTMIRWFYDNKYYFEEPTSRIRPGTVAGIEHEFLWTGWRKVNDYVKFNVRVWLYLWDVKDLEVIKDGKKVKLTKCRLQMEFDGEAEFDWQNRFEKTKFLQWLNKFFLKLVFREEKMQANYWDELYYRVYKLQTIAKEYLDMEAKGNAYYDIW